MNVGRECEDEGSDDSREQIEMVLKEEVEARGRVHALSLHRQRMIVQRIAPSDPQSQPN